MELDKTNRFSVNHRLWNLIYKKNIESVNELLEQYKNYFIYEEIDYIILWAKAHFPEGAEVLNRYILIQKRSKKLKDLKCEIK